MTSGRKAVFLATVTQQTPNGFRFRVDEQFGGPNSKFFDVKRSPCGYEYFEPGEQYVVFVDTLELPDGAHLVAHKCGPTRKAKDAQAILGQLRAEKQGRRVASLYGRLLRTLDPAIGIWDENYVRALPNL